MECRAANFLDIQKLSKLSVSLGNIPLLPGQCAASLLLSGEDIVGFAAAQSAWHAAGSWVREDYRKEGYTYTLRSKLEDTLRLMGAPLYFSIPSNEFEKQLFAKYGPVVERVVQVKVL